MAQKSLKVLDIFAGGGGLSLGFDLIKDSEGKRVFEIILAVDNDVYACKTLRKYFSREYGNEDIVLEADLTYPETHKKITEKCSNGVDIIIGGPPCQSFSLIGPRSGYGKNGDFSKHRIMDRLYEEYLALVEELKPAFVVFENVKGILSKKDVRGIKYIDIILSDFKKLGYSFESANKDIKTEYLILNSADYGVPQTRERVFLIGNNIGVRNPYPYPTHKKEEYVTLFEAIGDLPEVKARVTLTGVNNRKDKKSIERCNKKINSGKDSVKFHSDMFKTHCRSLGKTGRDFLDFVKPNGRKVLLHHVARGQKKDDIALFRGMKQGMTAKDVFESKKKNIRRLRKLIKYDMSSFPDKYRKQSWKKPCSTVFAHLQKDGNRFIHPDGKQARTITPREAARIQSFPDWYEFEGPLSIKFKQIGNAVPPLLALRIAKSVHNIVTEV
jgi:DNA (cytosine-5)-methyltransferase 1